MSAPYNQLLFKVEDSLAGQLNTIGTADSDGRYAISGAKIYKGAEIASVELPAIFVTAFQGAEKQPRGKGNFDVRARIEIRVNADDTARATMASLVGTVADLLSDSGIASTLSSLVTDFTVFNMFCESHERDTDDRSHIYRLEYLLHCCASDAA